MLISSLYLKKKPYKCVYLCKVFVSKNMLKIIRKEYIESLTVLWEKTKGVVKKVFHYLFYINIIWTFQSKIFMNYPYNWKRWLK